jgi:hypothetical protein
VGTVNVGFRALTCLTFYCGAAREGAHCHTRQAPRSGRISDRKTDLEIRPEEITFLTQISLSVFHFL